MAKKKISENPGIFQFTGEDETHYFVSVRKDWLDSAMLR